MSSENKKQAKSSAKKDSLKRRLSVIPKPTRRFFSFPSYRKKDTELTVPITITTEKIPPKEPAATKEVKIQEKLPVKPPVARIQHDTPTLQQAYNISLRKLQQSSQRPLIQILLVHQTITKATLKLSEGMHSVKLMHEHPDARGSNRKITFVRRRSGPSIQRFSSPPPYSTVENQVNDRDDDVPLGLLQREFVGPAAPIFVA
ncbi:hypothetical protein K7432_014437 [Basidiobolus ranarum]|uniref:Uncharacterized protein n=1 Tax=Basidiobolus ranarum TaxID=34480 RepID=A0ABR2WHM6_9FUNG